MATRVFYFVCALIGLFCVIALGYGPAAFALAGLTLAVLGFRRRRQSWWGLPLAAAGAALVASVGAGCSWRRVVEVLAGAFLLVAAVRMVGRTVGRRALVGRR